jgi:spermidine synthase
VTKSPSKKRPLPIESAVVQTEDRRASSGVLPLLLALLAGSGCAALIYEIVWFQLLELVIGSSAISLGLLLAAYMAGLCLGSFALPRFVSVRRHPIKVFALLEAGIAACALMELYVVPWIGRVYLTEASTGPTGLVLRGTVAAVCLLPPTLLMGGSLPAIARWVETTPKGVSWVGLLYSANIAGAVLGCLLAGFYLLRVYDMAVATYAAAAINGAVALLGFGLSVLAPYRPGVATEDRAAPPGRVRRAPGSVFVHLAIALSGLTALGAEVVWTRLLSLLLGGTVYTFSIILAVFLLGLWAGSGAGSFVVRRVREPQLALAACQVLLAAAIAATAYTLACSLPYWPVDPLLSLGPWYTFDLDIVRCLRAIFPATLLWGASFPLALAAAAAAGEDPARLSGEIYAANTLGSLAGSLAFSLVLIPMLGTRESQQLLIWLAAAGAALALVAAVLAMRERLGAAWPRTLRLTAAFPCVAVLAWALASTVSDVPWQVIAFGRRVAPAMRGIDRATDPRPATPLFVGEGISSSVAIAERGGERLFCINGMTEASSGLLDMRLQRMMGHLPALTHAGPRSVLVVGFGAGVTAGSFVRYPEVQRIVIAELEPIVPPTSGEFFGKQNYGVLNDRRTRVVYDDARHYVFTSRETFDVITTDPVHPWIKGAASLYSKEYYELIKSRLNPGGVVAQWVPLYESDEETVRTELATFLSVFPNGTVWSNYLNGNGYDLVLVGQLDAAPFNVNALQRRLNQAGYSGVSESLADVGIGSAVDLLSTYTGRAADLKPMLAGARVNEDMNMRLQYVAGLGLDSGTGSQVYREILRYRKWPDGLLTGVGDPIEALQAVIGRPPRTF